jgi:hypothetical protein
MVLMTDNTLAMSAEEHRGYDAGREAQRQGLDYFDNPHMHGGSLSLRWAWGLGWFDERDGVTLEQRFNPNMDDAEGKGEWQ